jgi:hypothetical protein
VTQLFTLRAVGRARLTPDPEARVDRMPVDEMVDVLKACGRVNPRHRASPLFPADSRFDRGGDRRYFDRTDRSLTAR